MSWLILFAGKEGVLRLHPDLAGRLAAAGQLTSESTKEQSAAGLHLMTEDERHRMSNLNEQYRNKFGFPFVKKIWGAQWLSGRVLDSRPKGSGFEPHRRHCVVVLEQDTFILA